MPIYEYSCKNCGQDFEELIFDDMTPACPHCGSTDTHKLVSCCARYQRNVSGNDSASTSSGASTGGCAGCSGGHCATCGH
ncbi:MAG: zinc ribbon domain-containing protein [Desulfovibrio sp.]|nr:zinc ribbon domain-containing protein [Desulfovibrio sp.]